MNIDLEKKILDGVCNDDEDPWEKQRAEDNKDVIEYGDGDDDRIEDTPLDPQIPEIGPEAFIDDRRYKFAKKSGPKGVIADYEEAKLKMRAKRMTEEVNRERLLQRIGMGSQSFVTPSLKTQIDNSDDDFEFSDDDLEIINQYKEKRMATMKQQIPRFGVFQELNITNFLSTIDSVPSSTYAVIHFHQPYIKACVRLTASLRAIAPFFTYILFGQIVATQVMPKYSDLGVPTLVFFKGGKQVKSFIRVTSEELGNDFSDTDLVNFLLRENVLLKQQTNTNKITNSEGKKEQNQNV